MVASQNGKTIAWVFNDKGSRNIYVAESPSFAAKKITTYTGDDGMAITDLNFTPDGNQIVFVRGNAPNGRGEAANPAFLQTSTERIIWMVNKDNGTVRKIATGFGTEISPDGKSLAYISGGQVWLASLSDTSIKPQKLFQSRGNQLQLSFSPDGKQLAFVSGRTDHSFIGLYNFTTKTVGYVEPSLDSDLYPVWSANSKYLAYIRIPNTHNLPPFTPVREANPWSIRLFNTDDGAAKEIWKATPGSGSVFVENLPVAKKLLWWAGNALVFPHEKDGWVHLYLLDTEKRTTRLLTPGNGEVENVTISPNGQTIYYTTNITDIERRHLWKVDVAGGSPQILTKGKGIEWSPVVTDNGVAFLHSSATKPPWPAVLQNDVVTDIGTELFPKDFPQTLVQPQVIMVKATDGMQVPAQLFLPPNHNPRKKYPALLFLHGGSKRQMLPGFHYGQYYSNAYALNQYFAAQGYVVVSLNYRSGIGYGLAFREALNYGISGASEVKDLIGAGLYLKSRADVDATKIALWGASYGGYLTAHGLAQAGHLFACGVDIHGVHNWNDELPTFAPWYDASKFPAMAKKALESSPVHFVKTWKNPVLLIHGDDDRNVPFSESVHIAELLRKQNVHVEQLVLPDEIHSFLLHSNWLKTYDATFEFIERQLKEKKKGF